MFSMIEWLKEQTADGTEKIIMLTSDNTKRLNDELEMVDLKLSAIRDDCELALDTENGRCKQFASHIITAFLDGGMWAD